MPRAARAADELLRNYQHVIEHLTLIPSRGGVFEVLVNDELVYSKKALGRHAAPEELARLLDDRVAPGVERYPQE